MNCPFAEEYSTAICLRLVFMLFMLFMLIFNFTPCASPTILTSTPSALSPHSELFGYPQVCHKTSTYYHTAIPMTG